MKDIAKQFKSQLSELLNQRLSEREEQSLIDEGFVFKKPTRTAAIMAALYKKAASGDLSAVKELRSILGEDKPASEGVVTIIDDITN